MACHRSPLHDFMRGKDPSQTQLHSIACHCIIACLRKTIAITIACHACHCINACVRKSKLQSRWHAIAYNCIMTNVGKSHRNRKSMPSHANASMKYCMRGYGFKRRRWYAIIRHCIIASVKKRITVIAMACDRMPLHHCKREEEPSRSGYHTIA